MSDAAEAVAANLSSGRNVTIELTNYTKKCCLADPKVYLENGNVHIPPQPTVRPLKTELCNYSKQKGKATGAVGVMTYDILMLGKKDPDKIAIMFSVPYDYNFYKNWFAIGIFPQSQGCNEDLYKKMYYKEDEAFVRAEAKGNCIMTSNKDVIIKATMSPLSGAIMKVEVWDIIEGFCKK
ncbi:actinoporin-like protein [Thalassophryne amazonica]|uniref:actinoporin-like protein n=1 Tax=Thalassophryne amazonica TaxID=390379 RepID=UPI0014712843|nr:actinoporin-like protein [Thalassophryne amazonica]